MVKCNIDKRNLGSKGFTLIELAVVITIMAILATGALSLGMGSFEAQKLKTTKERLETINQAMLDFVRENGRLPCPAGPLINETDTEDFGIETGNRVNYNDDPDNDTNNVRCNDGRANNNSRDISELGIRAGGLYDRVQTGTVPVKTLGLSNQYAFDGYGNRFSYVVDDDFTRSYGTNISSNEHAFGFADQDDPILQVLGADDPNASRTDDAVYVIISHGKNGYGAYKRVVSETSDNAVFNGTTSPNEAEVENINPNDANVFVDAPITVGDNPPTTAFDDILTYKTHIQVGAKSQGEKEAETLKKMEAIEDATMKYVANYGYLPCPNTTNLANIQIDSLPYNDSCSSNNGSLRTSIVPYTNLGLSREYVFDGWGRPFVYRVHRYFDAGENFGNREEDEEYLILDIKNSSTNSNNTAKTINNNIFILLSHGYRVNNRIVDHHGKSMNDYFFTTNPQFGIGDYDLRNQSIGDSYFGVDPVRKEYEEDNDDIVKFYKKSDILTKSCEINVSDACSCPSGNGYRKTTVGGVDCDSGNKSEWKKCGLSGIWGEVYIDNPTKCPK